MIKSKVFVGPGNIAGSAMYVAKSLRFVGIDAKSFSYNPHPFGYPCDYDNILYKNPFVEPLKRSLFQKLAINRYTLRIIWAIQKLFLFSFALLKYDTFIFISYETFFNNNKDLWLLKLLKKKIAFLFVGCPERDPRDIINQTDRGICSFCQDKKMQKNLHCYNGNKKKKKIESISSYADIIFAHRESTSFIIDKSKIRSFFCVTDSQIDVTTISNKFNNLNHLIITHLPSNTLLKGTSIVEIAIKGLRNIGYEFQYFSDHVRHSEVESILEKTHILIDQFSAGNGLLGVEGMANGCVVICRTSKWFREDFPELPLVSCEPEELVDTLIDLIKNREKMLSIALKSFEYYKKFHTPEVVGKYYKNALHLK
jgi:glycosyltransferase involved in cell wall biosynthesis